MNAGIQLTGIIQPSPDMIYDQNYEAGEVLLPLQDGQWTLFSVQPIFTSKDESLPTVREYHAGHPAATRCQVTWLAADQVAYGYSVGKFIEAQKRQEQAQRQQAIAAAAKPQLVLPTR